MDFPSKFNLIIDYIEKHSDQKVNDITNHLSRKLGMTPRSLNDSFLFVADLTLSTYIRLRRLVGALNYRFACEDSLESVALEFGYPDQPTFSKACKQLLGLSPTDITLETLHEFPPLTLEKIFEGSSHQIASMIKNRMQLTSFGTTEQELASILQLSEINGLYGFHPTTLSVVHSLISHHDITPEQAFDFMEDLLCMHAVDEPIAAEVLPLINDTAYLHFECSVDIDSAYHSILRLHKERLPEITELDKDILKTFTTSTASEFKLSWHLCSIFATLMKRYEVPIDEFDRVFEECLLLGGNPLFTVACHKELPTLPDYLDKHGCFPPHITQAIELGRLELPELEKIYQAFQKNTTTI